MSNQERLSSPQNVHRVLKFKLYVAFLFNYKILLWRFQETRGVFFISVVITSRSRVIKNNDMFKQSLFWSFFQRGVQTTKPPSEYASDWFDFEKVPFVVRFLSVVKSFARVWQAVRICAESAKQDCRENRFFKTELFSVQ